VPASPVSIAWGETYQALQQGAAESFAYQREGQAKANQEMIEMWKAAGIEVTLLTPEEKKVWRETLGHTLPVWDSFKQDYGADLYEDLVNMTT
jgi:TRAP-type C4-dicarboxylate transport system substrate-binding protein